jgi:hypothetical protein
MTRAGALVAVASAFALGIGVAVWMQPVPAAVSAPPLPQGDLYVIQNENTCACFFDGPHVLSWACDRGTRPGTAVCRIGVGGPL